MEMTVEVIFRTVLLGIEICIANEYTQIKFEEKKTRRFLKNT